MISELGILMGIVGAFYMVLGSFRARRKIVLIFRGLEGLKEIRNIREIVRNQARMELIGFMVLGSGLIMQFIGGLG